MRTGTRNIWFTEAQDPGKVGFVDPVTNDSTDFSTPTANSHPGGIAKSNGGALWFTEGAVNQIGAIDPTTHAFTEIALPANPNDRNGLRGARLKKRYVSLKNAICGSDWPIIGMRYLFVRPKSDLLIGSVKRDDAGLEHDESCQH
ncbi:MAG: hypothetical protein ACHRXM_33425 [Isosphaerales bacterium]